MNISVRELRFFEITIPELFEHLEKQDVDLVFHKDEKYCGTFSYSQPEKTIKASMSMSKFIKVSALERFSKVGRGCYQIDIYDRNKPTGECFYYHRLKK